MCLHLYSAWEFSPKLEFSSESSFYYRKQLHFVVLLHIYPLTYVMDRKILFEKWRLLLRILVWILLLFAHDLVDLKKAQSVVLHCCKMITEQVCICTALCQKYLNLCKKIESACNDWTRCNGLCLVSMPDQMHRSVSGFYAKPDATVCVWFLCQTRCNGLCLVSMPDLFKQKPAMHPLQSWQACFLCRDLFWDSVLRWPRHFVRFTMCFYFPSNHLLVSVLDPDLCFLEGFQLVKAIVWDF